MLAYLSAFVLSEEKFILSNNQIAEFFAGT